MASNIDAQVISDDEKTFQYQDDLLPLPVPDLDQTLKKYLDSVKPHVTEEELRQVEVLCQQFACGEGKFLHEKLKAFAQNKKNWLEKWWEDVAYLQCRLPNPLVNMAGPGPYMFDVWKPSAGTQIQRAALLLYFIMHFWQLVRREKIRPQKDSNGKPLCMNQFLKIFNTCNIPGVFQDHLVHYFKTEAEGPSPTHVVVMCQGHVFRLECVDEAGVILTPPKFQAQLQKIKDKAATLSPAPGVGYFTSLKRTDWAQNWSRLLALHPDNYNSLQCIQTAIVVIGLDDYSPADADDLAWNAFFGDPNNKWFDKSMNIIVYENGTVASNCDHTPMDGMMMVFSTYYAHCKVIECQGQWTGSENACKLQEPVYLQFHLDAPLLQSLNEAKGKFVDMGSSVKVKVTSFTDFGKNYLKRQNIHPDTCVQLALQLAYHRMYKRPAPTYETATTRQFYHGRTETVRSCTVEACKWCQAMCDTTVSDTESLQLFISAVQKQNKLMEEAKNLQGCDRHLYGLALVAKEEGLPVPDLFQHPAYFKSGGGGNFVLSTSCIGYTTVIGGVAPMCPHGYGIFYSIQDNKVMFVITTWTADIDTCCKAFSTQVTDALLRIRQLLDGAKAVAARL